MMIVASALAASAADKPNIEFPRRAKPATFGLDQVMDRLEKNATQ